MTEFIAELFSNIFNGNVVLATLFVSMVPIMELKGGIPFGMSEAFWGAGALSRWQAFWSAYLGCTFVVVILYFLFTPIMKLLRKTKMFKGLANYIDNRVKKQSSKIQENNNAEAEQSQQVSQTEPVQDLKSIRRKRFYKVLGVFIFTAIPLPLTGVWMGTCLAVVLELNFFESFVAVQLGNLVAGIIISTICVIFPQFTHILIYIFLILVAIVLIYEIIRNKINKNKSKIK